MTELSDTYTMYANVDPTRTMSLRNVFARDMNKRFRELIRAIKPATNVIFDMAISATLELNQDKDTVEQELSNSISAYMN